MLKLLKIKNFALLNDVEFELTKGFTVITGETGSGKSILLDALAFLLGKRADVGFIGSLSDKCVIEGKFNLSTYHFKEFFKEVDWEYDDETIVRREFSQNGRSRIFVNDTPVLISDLKTFGDFSMPKVPDVPPFSIANSSRKGNILEKGIISTPGTSLDL